MNAPVRPGTLSAGATSVALPLSLPDPAIRFERVGKTSVTVDVEVFAERNPEHPVVVKVTEAKLTYVAVDAFRAKRHIDEA